ncbi:MAG: hypothetical protein FWB90_03950 [Fibromonadales bacterium]|nr:hypothetical protein [Fibromonadales bacterium]
MIDKWQSVRETARKCIDLHFRKPKPFLSEMRFKDLILNSLLCDDVGYADRSLRMIKAKLEAL